MNLLLLIITSHSDHNSVVCWVFIACHEVLPVPVRRDSTIPFLVCELSFRGFIIDNIANRDIIST